MEPRVIVETGTYLGTTTEWLASFQLPLYSCEIVPEHYGFSRARLQATPNATLFLADSRAALREFFGGAPVTLLAEPLLIYLDSHWHDDLPLRDELEIIFTYCTKAVVVIDDFQVPDDTGYSFDDYGDGKALTPAYIDPVVRNYNLAVFYPAIMAAQETGAKRGCVVLSTQGEIAHKLSKLSLLRTISA